MSLINGLGNTDFPNIAGDPNYTDSDVNNLTVNGNLSIVPIGIDNDQLGALAGISSNIQYQLDNLQTQISGVGGLAYNGVFYDNASYGVPTANTAFQVALPYTLGTPSGMSISSNTITITNTGIYRLYSMLSIGQTVTLATAISWFRVKPSGGAITDISNSNCEVRLSGNTAQIQPLTNSVVYYATAGDEISLWWAQTGSAKISYSALPTGTYPGLPTVRLEIVALTRQGAQGIQGATGAQGATGERGFTGTPGVNGLNGTNGTNGATGATGATGAKGDKGDKGDTGASFNPLTDPTIIALGVVSADNAWKVQNIDTIGTAPLVTTFNGAVNSLGSFEAPSIAGVAVTAGTVAATTSVSAPVMNATTFNGTNADLLGSVECVNVTATGTLDAPVVNTDTLVCTTEITGAGAIGLATSTAHVLQAPTITLSSETGVGGDINIGGLADVVYVQGRLFQSYFQQFTPPP